MNRRDRLGDEWEPRWKTRLTKHQQDKMRDRRTKELEKNPPDLTNKQRHEIRRKARKDAIKFMENMKEVTDGRNSSRG